VLQPPSRPCISNLDLRRARLGPRPPRQLVCAVDSGGGSSPSPSLSEEGKKLTIRVHTPVREGKSERCGLGLMQGQLCHFVPILTLSSAPHKTVIKSLFIFKKQEENHQVEKISVKSPFMFKTWAR
jgi:hypothetical protein